MEDIIEELELKQSETMERLDNVEDEKRRQKLEDDLKQIEAAIAAFSWMRGKKQNGIAREEDVISEDFSELKGQRVEERQDEKIDNESYNEAIASLLHILRALAEKKKEGLYDEALAMMSTPDYSRGVDMMRSLAENGYVHAMLLMGNMYREGNRVVKNVSIAVEWYRKAAAQGNVEAQYNLGWLYCNGEGVAEDFMKSVEWYRKAAAQGYAAAQCNLGYMYEMGYGVASDYLKAVEWYRKAARQGNTVAQSNLRNLGESY